MFQNRSVASDFWNLSALFFYGNLKLLIQEIGFLRDGKGFFEDS